MLRVGIVLSMLLLALLCAGYIYQTRGVSKDIKVYKPVGELYEINHKKMHVYTGGAGETTVVFAAGWGTVNPYADFYPLYDQVSKHAKYVVYDRFGYGYSDVTDQERDIDHIVNEIHELLVKSGQKPPYIFVGHSLASLETLRYAQIFKNELKGIVLVDAGSPELYADTKPMTFISVIQREIIRFGLARMLYNVEGFVDSQNSERNQRSLLPKEIQELDTTAALLLGGNKNIIDEMRNSQANAKKVIAEGRLEDVPLTIITAGEFGKANKGWLESQEKMKEWSPSSKQFVVQDAMHYIHQYQPEIIANEILNIINNER